MSYILEALKRADAERDRGAVPTLHSHAMPATAKTPSRIPAANWIAAIAVLALVVGAALWWTLGRQPVQPAQVAPVATPPVVAATPAVPAAPVQPAPIAAATAPPVPTVAPRKNVEPAHANAARPAASATLATAAPRTATASATATQGVVYSVADLPDDIRSQLPKLTISGATYSTQAAYRMLIVNGQVLHENDAPAPGLTLETIRQGDVVLRFKGYRYSVAY